MRRQWLAARRKTPILPALVIVVALVVAVGVTFVGWRATRGAASAAGDHLTTVWEGDLSAFPGDSWIKTWGVANAASVRLDKLQVVSDGTAPGGYSLAVRYPAGSSTPSCEDCPKTGGAQFYTAPPVPLGGAVPVRLTYALKLPKEFDFGLGGILPGLYGGPIGHATGGRHGQAWSTRLIWRPKGAEVVAGLGIYTPTNGDFGEDAGLGAFVLPRDDRWHLIEQEVDRAAETVTLWFDQRQVFQGRVAGIGGIPVAGIMFSTFFGGRATSWGPVSDTIAEFAGFSLKVADTPSETSTHDSHAATPPAVASPTPYPMNPSPGETPSGSQAPSKDRPGLDRAAAPYLYFGWGNPPDPVAVMKSTGIKAFTIAFVNSDGSCNPTWDGLRPLTGGIDERMIRAIRGAGGDVVVSFGGWNGQKLGEHCANADALATAYIKVIDAYDLTAIDIDIENTEMDSTAAQDRVVGALKLVKQRRPAVTTILTIGTGVTGPSEMGRRILDAAASTMAGIDIFTIMPFDFGATSDMYASTVQAAEALHAALMERFGWSSSAAYSHMGITSMNGVTDTGETVSLATFEKIRDWAAQQGLARLAFWSANRDRGCAGGGLTETCSGISQPDWAFTKAAAGFR